MGLCRGDDLALLPDQEELNRDPLLTRRSLCCIDGHSRLQRPKHGYHARDRSEFCYHGQANIRLPFRPRQ